MSDRRVGRGSLGASEENRRSQKWLITENLNSLPREIEMPTTRGKSVAVDAGHIATRDAQIKHDFKRRVAIEPVVGHLQDDHRAACDSYLARDDGINAVLATAGYNFRRLIQWLRSSLFQNLTAWARLFSEKNWHAYRVLYGVFSDFFGSSCSAAQCRLMQRRHLFAVPNDNVF